MLKTMFNISVLGEDPAILPMEYEPSSDHPLLDKVDPAEHYPSPLASTTAPRALLPGEFRRTLNG
jgi:hypothetical protein